MSTGDVLRFDMCQEKVVLSHLHYNAKLCSLQHLPSRLHYWVSYLIFTLTHRSLHDQKHVRAHLCNGASPYYIVLTSSPKIFSFSSHRIDMCLPLGLCSWCPFCLGCILWYLRAYSLVSSTLFPAMILKIM